MAMPGGSKRFPGGTVTVAALCMLALLLPLVVSNRYVLHVLSLAYIMAISASGLNLVLGYAGQLNLAHAGFMAIGAYTVGILTVDYHVPFWIAFLLGGPMAAGLGYVCGLLSLRLKAHYFAIFTLCVAFILYLFIDKTEGLTHGPVGIIGIPAPPRIGPVSFDGPQAQYYLLLFFLAAALFAMHRIVSSLSGRAMLAVRNNEDLAAALGVNVMRTKMTAFVLSTFYAGVAGSLYAGFVRFLGPSLAQDSLTFDLLTYVIVGGSGTLFGPLIGTLVVTLASESLQGLRDYQMVIFGPLLVALVIYFPQGIAGWFRTMQTGGGGEDA